MAKKPAWLLLVLALALAGAAAAGTAPPEPTLSALLTEVRLLREAMERSGLAAARIQLLNGRAAVQDQRLARIRSEAAAAERETTTLTNERTRMQQIVAEMERSLESESDAARRASLEQELTQMRIQIRHHDTLVDDSRSRRGQLLQSLETERGRHEDIEARLDELERELERAARR